MWDSVGLVLAGAALGIETWSFVADLERDSKTEEVVVAADKVTVKCVRKSAALTTTPSLSFSFNFNYVVVEALSFFCQILHVTGLAVQHNIIQKLTSI